MPAFQKKAATGFNLAASLKAHAKDETDYTQDYSSLPAGIIGGIAELREARMGTYKSGKSVGGQYIYLAGVVITPEHAVNTVK